MRDDGGVASRQPADQAAVARVLQVPLIADSVAPPRLVYGGLDLYPGQDTDQAYTAVYFVIADDRALGRVTFEGLDAIRASRGETIPYPSAGQRGRGDWVFIIEGSRWLQERHDYEMRRYTTPLLDTHQHYLFQFHDEFIEAIAEGIWLDHADSNSPFAQPTGHPLEIFGLDMPADRFTSVAGIEWELRRSPRSDQDLIRGSQYCSQRVFQLNLNLDGRSSESASIWIRTTDGMLRSSMVRPWPLGELARIEGFAQPNDFSDQWHRHLKDVAERRRRMGK